MNYDRLSQSYWSQQVSRIEALRQRIVDRGEAAADGRVVPDDDTLAIGTGRTMSMAVMFLDLCGFSARPADTPPDQDLLVRVLNLFFTEMFRIAEDYGGTVEKNTGDGLMAYFEDRASDGSVSGSRRAVAAALSMIYTNMYAIAPILRASAIPELRFRIGIDYGTVTVARLGAPRRFSSIVAVGTTANIASKMLAEAAPDEILVGDGVLPQLPIDWWRFLSVKTVDTGWMYVPSQKPYSFWTYSGRWTKPL